MNRRALISMMIGGVISQALYGALRAYSLYHDRAFALAATGVDPATDIWVNIAVAAASLLLAALLLTANPWIWWLAVAVMIVGALDALRLSVAPYGGNGYIGLLLLRVVAIGIATTPLMRAVFRVSSPGRD